jgi:outer membrane usher protein
MFVTIAAATLMNGGSVSAQDVAVLLPLTINEASRGEIAAVIRGDDVLVGIADLERSGLSGQTWDRLLTFARLKGAIREVGGVEVMSLSAAAPLLTFRFDDQTLTLSVTAAPGFLPSTRLNVGFGPPPELVYSQDTSSFLNYSIMSAAGRTPSLFAETGTSIGGSLLLNSFSRPAGGRVVRLTSSYLVDQRKKLLRWTLGDAPVSSDTLGGSALVGGVTVSRNFSIDPYFVRYPSLNFGGTALTPSRLDVYVNGALVLQQDVAPGQFDLSNIPVSAGAGTARIVVRDVFGREQTHAAPYYYSTEILARGLSEYLYSAGFIRERFGSESFDYGDPAVVGFHRLGVTNDLTLAGRVEATSAMVSGGPAMSARTRLGDFDLAIGYSDADGRAGHAEQIGYRYLGRRMSFGGVARRFSRQYSTLSTRWDADRPLLDTNAYVAFRAGRASMTLLWNSTDMRDQLNTDRLSLTTTVPIGRRASVFASLARVDQGRGWNQELFAGLSVFLGGQTAAGITISDSSNGTQVVTDVQRALPVGTGFGYRVVGRSSPGAATGNAALQYQTSFGRYEVELDSTQSNRRSAFSAAGGLVYAKGTVFPTRPVQESFAIVRVPGVENVRIYADNRLIGRTNDRGELLIPNLLSYYGNRLSIEDRDIPLEFEVRDVEETIAPPYRGGAIVEFPVERIQTVTGTFVIRTATASVVPQFGQLTVTTAAGVTHESPIGRGGEFYLENIASGPHGALIEYADGQCRLELQIPGTDEAVVKLGLVICPSEGVKP